MDVPEIPADLITLEQQRTAALEELLTYSDGISAQRRAEYPDPEQIVERQTWTPEQSTKLNELRAAYNGCRSRPPPSGDGSGAGGPAALRDRAGVA